CRGAMARGRYALRRPARARRDGKTSAVRWTNDLRDEGWKGRRALAGRGTPRVHRAASVARDAGRRSHRSRPIVGALPGPIDHETFGDVDVLLHQVQDLAQWPEPRCANSSAAGSERSSSKWLMISAGVVSNIMPSPANPATR